VGEVAALPAAKWVNRLRSYTSPSSAIAARCARSSRPCRSRLRRPAPRRRATCAHASDPNVVLVDLGTEPAKGEQLCSALHARYPGAAILAVVCCQQSVGFWHLQAVLGSAISGVIDLHATPEEATRAIASAARGSSVLHLQLGREQQGFLRDALIRRDGRSETNLRVLTLVSRGLPDHEIGRRLHLSPHTVKHYVEQLREELGVRNRIELASWAGRAGLYTADRDVARDESGT
jgi:DNA-binding NarL/FixJ family response regulator